MGKGKSDRVKRPKHVVIGPVKFKIVVSAPLMAEKMEAMGDVNLMGYCDVSRQTIILKPDQGPDVEKNTLSHEILHAVWHLTGASTRKEEEDIILAIDSMLLDTYQRNRQLREYLFG